MMKKLLALTLALLTVLLCMPSCGARVPDVAIDPVEERLAVGDEITLKVTNGGKKKLDNEDLLWSCAHPEVATVSAEGLVTVKGAGYCEITARHKDDLSHSATVGIFCPYATVEETEATWERMPDDWMSTGLWDAAAKFTWKYGRMLIKGLTGTMNAVGIVTTVFSFFSKDNYLFSMMAPLYQVKDAVVYTVSDWGNESCTLSWDRVTAQSIGANLTDVLKKDHEYGDSFEDLIALMRLSLMSELANDGTYHLDRMDDRYEYRVVVRADFSTFTSMDFYSNGLLTGLGLSIKEILDMDLQEINDNYTYQIYKNEILNVENLRLCVECRPKG